MWLLGCGMFAPLATLCAQPPAVSRAYTEEHPLVYEDAWDLYPYSFLNDEGEPEGFNIDVIKLLMNELGIPYTIKLRHGSEAFADLRDGKSDLMMGLAAGFHDEYGRYGKNAITLFTQSVATPKNKPVSIRNFHDLEYNHVVVNAGSLCYHLMKDYGWEDNATQVKDIAEALMQISNTEEGQVVWNDLSLKWAIRRYNIENLQVTPVNMPHGEYRFMSNDPALLNRLDEAYSRLNATDRITTIQNKWFYPDRQRRAVPEWVWWAVAVLAVLMFVLCSYTLSYHLQANKLRRENARRHKRLALIMETGHVRFWTYDIASRKFVWRTDEGYPAHTYTEEDFGRRYVPGDFDRVMSAIGVLKDLPPQDLNGDEREVSLNIQAQDTEDANSEMRHYMLRLSVLKRDGDRRPMIIIGTKKDITEELGRHQQAESIALRYQTVFNTPVIGMMHFDANGILVEVNERSCEMYNTKREEVLAAHLPLNFVLGIGDYDLDLNDVDGFCATQLINLDAIADEDRRVPEVHRKGWLCYEFSLLAVKDDEGKLTGIIGFCKDTNDLREVAIREKQLATTLASQREELQGYDSDIDLLLREGDIRLVTYSPAEHTLNIYRNAREVMHSLTQMRCMALVDDRGKRVALRTLEDMDDGVDHTITANISTTLQVHHLQLNVSFTLAPVHDANGNVTEYYGICRDMTQLREIERLTAIQQAKIQDVEDAKSGFVKNMVQEIRRPMEAIVDCVGSLDPEHAGADEATTLKAMLDNCNALLSLIANILHLSRLQSHIVGITRSEIDFSTLFDAVCAQGWQKYQNANTQYIIENPYEQLVVDIDAANLSHVIVQLIENAAKHTPRGSVRARYDYIGRRLLIGIDDTGNGMPEQLVKLANMQTAELNPGAKGLGLAICKEIISQMDGTLEFSSGQGLGTTAYISIPCHVTAIRRKKFYS